MNSESELLPSALCPLPLDAVQTPALIEEVEAQLLRQPQVDCPLTHTFAPGVYFREVLMPAGTRIIGHEHKTEHLNIVLTGRAVVMMDGAVEEIVAPAYFRSPAGVRKVLVIEEDMRWMTVHPTHETDLEKLADLLIVKSRSFLDYHAELDALKRHIELSQTNQPVEESL